nr:MAG TPA: hypothetical protein [Caudoviricetes sp.]
MLHFVWHTRLIGGVGLQNGLSARRFLPVYDCNAG